MVKVLDSQPRVRGLESRHTLGLCLKSLGEILPQMCLAVIVNMQLLACRESHKINPSLKTNAERTLAQDLNQDEGADLEKKQQPTNQPTKQTKKSTCIY